MSLSLRACLRRQGNHKTMKVLLFLPTDTFLFRLGFLSTLSGRQRRQQEEADGEGHLNKPSVEPGSRAQPDLWLSTPLFPHRGPSLELLDVLDPVYYLLSPLSTSPSFPLPVPLSHSSFFMSIYLSPFLFLRICWYFSLSLSPPSFLPDILASCSPRQGVYSCLCEAELQLQR